MKLLEFIIAILFLCFLLSLFVSSIVDMYSDISNRKGKHLKKMLAKILDDNGAKEWVNQLYNHPLISSLSYSNKRLTSYIPSRVFSLALSDLRAKNKGLMNGSNLSQVIELLDKETEDHQSFLESIETWYNEYMFRVNHAYKRLLRTPMWVVAFAIAIVFNIDAVKVGTTLWQNATMANNIAIEAESYVKNNSVNDSASVRISDFKKYKSDFDLPIGWKFEKTYYKSIKDTKDFSLSWYIIIKLLGLFITAMIASMGAPFWYDILQKIIGVKGSLKPKKE